jgi:hypothetical protein
MARKNGRKQKHKTAPTDASASTSASGAPETAAAGSPETAVPVLDISEQPPTPAQPLADSLKENARPACPPPKRLQPRTLSAQEFEDTMAARKRGEMPAEFDGLPCGHSCCAIILGYAGGHCTITETQAMLAGYAAYHAEACGDEPRPMVDIRACLELMVAHERSLAAHAHYAAAYADSPVRALSGARAARYGPCAACTHGWGGHAHARVAPHAPVTRRHGWRHWPSCPRSSERVRTWLAGSMTARPSARRCRASSPCPRRYWASSLCSSSGSRKRRTRSTPRCSRTHRCALSPAHGAPGHTWLASAAHARAPSHASPLAQALGALVERATRHAKDESFWLARYKDELTSPIQDYLTCGEMAAYDYRKAVDL